MVHGQGKDQGDFVWSFIFKPTLVSMYQYLSVSIYIFYLMVISFRSGCFYIPGHDIRL
jgi:hypothetical protein